MGNRNISLATGPHVRFGQVDDTWRFFPLSHYTVPPEIAHLGGPFKSKRDSWLRFQRLAQLAMSASLRALVFHNSVSSVSCTKHPGTQFSKDSFRVFHVHFHWTSAGFAPSGTWNAKKCGGWKAGKGGGWKTATNILYCISLVIHCYLSRTNMLQQKHLLQ